MAEPLLQTRDLSMHFGGVRAVRNVDFTLDEGELRCLIGPNGAGKSTFFKMLTGQLEPTHGQVLFRGKDISNAHAHEIARLGIGIKTQVPSVFNGLTTRQNLWIAAARHAGRKEADAAVEAQMARLGLVRFADRLVGQLARDLLRDGPNRFETVVAGPELGLGLLALGRAGGQVVPEQRQISRQIFDLVPAADVE